MLVSYGRVEPSFLANVVIRYAAQGQIEDVPRKNVSIHDVRFESGVLTEGQQEGEAMG